MSNRSQQTKQERLQANETDEKASVDVSKCYDEIDQIYDYIRGLAPLPSQLRKIKSIDFELLEKQQKAKQASFKSKLLSLQPKKCAFTPVALPASAQLSTANGKDKKEELQLSASQKSSLTSNRVSTEDNNITVQKSKQGISPKIDALPQTDTGDDKKNSDRNKSTSQTNRTSNKFSAANINNNKSNSVQGPLPVRLTTTTTVANRPLVKRVESLNLGAVAARRQPCIKPAANSLTATGSSGRPQAATLNSNITDKRYNLNPQSTTRSPNKLFKLPRAHSTSVLNKNDAHLDSDVGHSRILPHYAHVTGTLPSPALHRSRQQNLSRNGNGLSSSQQRKLTGAAPPVLWYHPSVNHTISPAQITLRPSVTPTSTATVTPSTAPRRQVSSGNSFPPLPPVPTSTTTKSKALSLRASGDRRRLTAIGIEQTTIDSARQKDNQTSNTNNGLRASPTNGFRIVPYSLNNFDPLLIEAPHIDDDPEMEDSSSSSNTTLLSLTSSEENRLTHNSSMREKSSVQSRSQDEDEEGNDDITEDDDQEDDEVGEQRRNDVSDHIYEALDNHRSSPQILSRCSNSMSDLHSFSSNSYVSTDSPNSSFDDEILSNKHGNNLRLQAINDSRRKRDVSKQKNLSARDKGGSFVSSSSFTKCYYKNKVLDNDNKRQQVPTAKTASRKIEPRENGSSENENVSKLHKLNNNNEYCKSKHSTTDNKSSQSDHKENNSSGVDLESSTLTKRRKNKKSSEKLLNLIGLNSPNTSHTSSSRKSSALSSNAQIRERRSDSGGSYQHQKPAVRVENGRKEAPSGHRSTLTSPIAAMFVAAASALKRTPTPNRDDCVVNETMSPLQLLNTRNKNLPAKTRVSSSVNYPNSQEQHKRTVVRHYKHPTVQVVKVPCVTNERNSSQNQRKFDRLNATSDPVQQRFSAMLAKASASNSDSSTSSYEAAIKNSSCGLLANTGVKSGQLQILNDKDKRVVGNQNNEHHRQRVSEKVSNGDMGHSNLENSTNTRTLIKVPKLSRKSHLLKPITSSLNYIDK